MYWGHADVRDYRIDQVVSPTRYGVRQQGEDESVARLKLMIRLQISPLPTRLHSVDGFHLSECS